MSDLHVDDFHRDSACILLQLYSQFPRPQILYVDSICGPDTPDEFGLPSNRTLACFSAMLWLGAEGYLRYDSCIRQEALDQAVLTEKGFLLLSAPPVLPLEPDPELNLLPPEALEISLSNVMLLRRALKQGSSTVISRCVQHLLRQPEH